MLSSFLRKFSNPFAKKRPLPDVGRIILTASCKGGVGKSTVALNTAISLSELGNRVGILDADLYGPSIPTMTSTTGNTLQRTQDELFLPIPAYGIETLSIGNAIKKDDALLWKGPLVGGLIGDLLTKTLWPPLDYLIVDTPPGTGDVQLSLYQSVKIDGAILVTSPQEVAIADVIRNIDMFKKMNIPILGIVQNFDGFVCPCCNKVTKIFNGRGGIDLAEKFKLEVLASLAVDPTLAEAADAGFPAVLKNPNSDYARAFRTLALRVMTKMPKVPEEEAKAEKEEPVKEEKPTKEENPK
ncbi:iron-sulfur cluster carrier protein ApbC [Histomonas meleagridis]|uniref:iron-sulfur cluster carrier protein ApbC n=1 Tax=Histomonas meleagridis TaxID=135588 RepID=UPI00355A0371|nr:iron-sulfur cluster carrier protein ApbC [Histomonas meleagridis]KAH0806511.1 iron-sulfur cluster carrier protein ApbC [Histomonas meleagridis]